MLSDMGRSGESVTRVDIRFPNEMYDKIQQIAVKDGARTHHISQKVEVSPTVIKLVQFALDALAGKLPDTVPDSTIDLSDRNSSISDTVSDKRIEAIVDRRLAELGLLPDHQTEDDSTLQLLPDNLSGILSDKDVMISDKDALLPDSLPDTENIPSDDSSNVDPVVEDVQVIKTDAIEQVNEDHQTSFTFAEFHRWLGLPCTTRNKANGDIAIDAARSQRRGDWEMSRKFIFTKQIKEY